MADDHRYSFKFVKGHPGNTRCGLSTVSDRAVDKTTATVLTHGMIGPGMHLNAVGGDCPGKTELDGAILDAAKVFEEHEPQSHVEGDIQHKPVDVVVTGLWQLLGGERRGRDTADQVTVFDSVGFALEGFRPAFHAGDRDRTRPGRAHRADPAA